MNEPVLKFVGLAQDYGATEVLRGIDAEARAGDVIGLLGLNGAGKTTLLETALGFSPPSAGSTLIFGQDSMTLDEAAKVRIGFVPQRDELLENLTGKRYLDLIAQFYSLWNEGLIGRLGREWDVPLDKKIGTLSIGQRQKLSILSALGHEPELLLLDEPVASLDPMARRQFLKELVTIADSRSRTIVFSTHIVTDLERVVSRIWVLKDGRIAIDEELDALKEHSARVHLPPGVPVPPEFRGNALIHCRSEQNAAVLVFKQWNQEQQRLLEFQTGCALAPEWLSLEDIFLELHA